MHSTALPSPALRHQEAFYGKDIVLADRNVVESEADSIYASAKDEDVSFLVVGDPLCATTHTDLIIRARELGVKVRLKIVVLGSSIASCFFFFFNCAVSVPSMFVGGVFVIWTFTVGIFKTPTALNM